MLLVDASIHNPKIESVGRCNASTVSVRTGILPFFLLNDFVHPLPNSTSPLVCFSPVRRSYQLASLVRAAAIPADKPQPVRYGSCQFGVRCTRCCVALRCVAHHLSDLHNIKPTRSSPSHNTPVFPCLFRPLFLVLLYILLLSGLRHLSLSILLPVCIIYLATIAKPLLPCHLKSKHCYFYITTEIEGIGSRIL